MKIVVVNIFCYHLIFWFYSYEITRRIQMPFSFLSCKNKELQENITEK